MKSACSAGRLALLLVSAIALAQEASTAPAAPPAAATNAGIPATAPSLGEFREGSYRNDYFGFAYPMGDEWVRKTTFARSALESSQRGSQSALVLLAGFHVPKNNSDPFEDASFTLFALAQSPHAPAVSAPEQLAALAAAKAQRKVKQKGEVTQFEAAGVTFYRADFDASGGRVESQVCALVKGYMLQWSFLAESRSALEDAIATLRLLTKYDGPPPPPIRRVRVSQGVSQGLIVRKVQPDYPAAARDMRIQGSVILSVLISHTGDVDEIKVVAGPSALIPPALKAVRQWKYKPYLLQGEPVEVETQITVVYSLSMG